MSSGDSRRSWTPRNPYLGSSSTASDGGRRGERESPVRPMGILRRTGSHRNPSSAGPPIDRRQPQQRQQQQQQHGRDASGRLSAATGTYLDGEELAPMKMGDRTEPPRKRPRTFPPENSSSSSSSPFSAFPTLEPTEDAVLKMVNAEPFGGPLTVELFDVSRTGGEGSGRASEAPGSASASSSSARASNGGIGENDEEEERERLPYAATVSDGSFSVRAIIAPNLTVFDSLRSSIESPFGAGGGVVEGSSSRGGNGASYLVTVHGYVTSEANCFQASPFLFLSDLTVREVREGRRSEPLPPSYRPEPGRRIPAGYAGAFLSDRAPFFSDADLMGKRGGFARSGSGEHDSESATNAETRRLTANFLARHGAMMTLQSSSVGSAAVTATSSSSSSASGGGDGGVGAAANDGAGASNYAAALEDFASSQIERQEAGLKSNSGREGAERSRLVVRRHGAALAMALGYAERRGASNGDEDDLTPDDLRQWHAELCGGGLHPEAGRLRSKSVRAGHSLFVPPDRVASELDKMCRGLRSLESRLLRHANPSSQRNAGLGPVLFAAAALYGVVTVHPFADGNGRLSRVAANWALRRGGLPFVINLFATPAQRSEYVRALQATRRNLSVVGRGSGASDDAGSDAFCSSGAFAPLVDVLSDRIARAASELDRTVSLRSVRSAEEAEDRAARRVRERAASSGSCLICFDPSPNVATLCCGQAVHLNCIAEWLSSRTSCPQCRGDMPGLPTQIRPRQAEEALALSSNNAGAGDLHAAVAEMEAVVRGIRRSYAEEETDYDTTTVDGQDNNSTASARGQYDDTTYDTEDDAGGRRSPVAPGPPLNDAASTTSFDNYDASASTSSEFRDPPARPVPERVGVFCTNGSCGNRAAVDCTNGQCGRCCVLHGRFNCTRHGG